MDKLTSDQITIILRKRIYDGILAGGLSGYPDRPRNPRA
jgi:hypothetical protein